MPNEQRTTTRTDAADEAGLDVPMGSVVGHGPARRRPERVHLPIMDDSLRPSPRRASGTGEAGWRFGLASLVRVSDKIVAGLVAAYNRALALDEDEEAEIYVRIGQDLAREGRAREAQEALRRAVALEPGHGAAWYELGVLHLRRGAALASAKALCRAKESGYDVFRVHRQLAEALIRQEQLEDAVEALKEARGARPDEAETIYRLGTVLDRMGRYGEAVDVLRRAVELAPEEPDYHQSLGLALESAGQRKEAVECFKRALDMEHARELLED